MALDAKNLFFGVGFFILMGLATLIFALLRPKSRRLSLWAQSALLLGFAFYFSPGPTYWLGPYVIHQSQELELHPPSPDCEHTFPVIIVLGAGMHTPELPSMAAQERLFHAAQLLTQLSQDGQSRAVILTGGPTLRGSEASEAKAAEPILRAALGPDISARNKFFQEGRSLNTHENALYSAQLVAQAGMPMDAVLITSQLHMPRAAAAFKKQGFNVCVFPNPEPKLTQALSFENGAHTFMLINELIGDIVYRLRGWS